MTRVWDTLVGQLPVIEALSAAAGGHGMTHAWLFTGPPGSGRSNAALAFAAALQCKEGGCADCEECRNTMAESHPDVTVTRTDKVIITVDQARGLVRDAAMMPVRGRWQILVVEDADRFNDQANNALLKAIEEPHPRTVWILCAPSVEDVLPTIRSRSRHVSLATPSEADVTDFLVREHGVGLSLAAHAARASQGHIGRAKALALDEETRNRRREVVRLPVRLTDLGSCMTAAANLVDLANQAAAAQAEEVAQAETQDLKVLYGEDQRSKATKSYRAAVSQLAEAQKKRSRRTVFDMVDSVLTDLVSVYRDVIMVQTGAGRTLVNEEQRPEIAELARRTTAEDNLRRIDAIYAAREQMMEFNTPPLLALEAMMVALRH